MPLNFVFVQVGSSCAEEEGNRSDGRSDTQAATVCPQHSVRQVCAVKQPK